MEERIRHLRQYRWSTYRSYIGKCEALDFVEYGPILAMSHGRQSQWPKRYREYVEAGLAESDDEFQAALAASPRSIGSEGFRAWVDDLYQKLVEGHSTREDIAFRRITEPLAVEAVLNTVAEVLDVEISSLRERRRNSPLRAIAARMLIRFAAQTQRQAAEHLCMGTGGAVSAQVRRLSSLLDEDARLRSATARIERRLAERREEKSKSVTKVQNNVKW